MFLHCLPFTLFCLGIECWEAWFIRSDCTQLEATEDKTREHLAWHLGITRRQPGRFMSAGQQSQVNKKAAAMVGTGRVGLGWVGCLGEEVAVRVSS